MGTEFREDTSADVVAASFDACADDRLREVLTSMVRHLHGFVRDVEPSWAEWEQVIGFLTRTGQKCDATRQEYILLSDVLGVSMLVDAIANRRAPGATDSTVLGPFHLIESPPRDNGADIALDGKGGHCVVTGRVTALDGTPLPGARVDVWQANDEGFYDVQQPGVQPEGNLRGLFTTDAEGRFWFRSVVPRHYSIPADGPVGAMLAAAGRHPYRPAHIHFIAEADGHHPVTTHMFVAGDPYLESDTVFGVKPSLIREYSTVDDPERATAYGVPNPFRHVDFTLVLEPS